MDMVKVFLASLIMLNVSVSALDNVEVLQMGVGQHSVGPELQKLLDEVADDVESEVQDVNVNSEDFDMVDPPVINDVNYDMVEPVASLMKKVAGVDDDDDVDKLPSSSAENDAANDADFDMAEPPSSAAENDAANDADSDVDKLPSSAAENDATNDAEFDMDEPPSSAVENDAANDADFDIDKLPSSAAENDATDNTDFDMDEPPVSLIGGRQVERGDNSVDDSVDAEAEPAEAEPVGWVEAPAAVIYSSIDDVDASVDDGDAEPLPDEKLKDDVPCLDDETGLPCSATDRDPALVAWTDDVL